MTRTAMLALIALLPTFVDDAKDHQGTWQAVSFVRDGKATPEEIVATVTRTVEGDHIVWKRDGKAFAGTSFVVNRDADPKTIDVFPDGGPDRDRAVLGIYKLDGEVLTLCMADPGRPRPTAFAADPGDKQTLMTFRRAEPARKRGGSPTP